MSREDIKQIVDKFSGEVQNFFLEEITHSLREELKDEFKDPNENTSRKDKKINFNNYMGYNEYTGYNGYSRNF